MATVREILRRKGSQVWTVSRSATVYEAIEQMTGHNAGSLVVMDGDEVCGIVTERDYMRNVALQGRSSRSTRVDEIMSSPVVCASVDDSVEVCMKVMTEKRCRHLPVVGDEGLAGLLSMVDLVEELVREQKTEIRELQDYIQGRYG